MAVFDGSLARQLDFGEVERRAPARVRVPRRSARGGCAQAGLRLAAAQAILRGPNKYQVLEHRRRQAQIKARRLLDLLETEAR